MSLSHDAMVGVVHRYIAALNASDLDAVVALYAPDATVEDPVGSAPHVGLEAIRSFYAGSVAMGLKVKLQGEVRAVANEVVFPFSVQLNMNGGQLTISPIDHFRLNAQGQITHMRAFFSAENFVQAPAEQGEAVA